MKSILIEEEFLEYSKKFKLLALIYNASLIQLPTISCLAIHVTWAPVTCENWQSQQCLNYYPLLLFFSFSPLDFAVVSMTTRGELHTLLIWSSRVPCLAAVLIGLCSSVSHCHTLLVLVLKHTCLCAGNLTLFWHSGRGSSDSENCKDHAQLMWVEPGIKLIASCLQGRLFVTELSPLHFHSSLGLSWNSLLFFTCQNLYVIPSLAQIFSPKYVFVCMFVCVWVCRCKWGQGRGWRELGSYCHHYPSQLSTSNSHPPVPILIQPMSMRLPQSFLPYLIIICVCCISFFWSWKKPHFFYTVNHHNLFQNCFKDTGFNMLETFNIYNSFINIIKIIVS